MKILITGGTGFIGVKLATYFSQQGFQVFVLTRNPTNTKELNGSIHLIAELDHNNVNYDIIINLAGQPLNKNRWNEKIKKNIYDSRIEITQKIIDYIKKSSSKPKLLISGSAIGFYGHHGDQTFTENSLPADNSFTSKLCKDWEQTAAQASKYGVRICLLRTGIVLGKHGGALKEMILPFKLGLGVKLGSGNQWMSWIHIDDVIGIIDFLIHKNNLDGPFNVTSPEPTTNKVFSNELAKALNRRCILTMPNFLVEILFGEMGATLLLKGQKVKPDKLITAGYQFKFLKLSEALKNILQ